ncbi:MAG: site-2 protease family protein [Planctomycetota bacterium]
MTPRSEPVDAIAADLEDLAGVDPSVAPEPPKVVRLDPELSFRMVRTGGVDVVRVSHPGTNVYFQFGMAEAHVARMFDGVRDSDAIAEALLADGLIDWRAEDVSALAALLVQNRLASVCRTPLPDQRGGGNAAGPPSAAQASLSRLLLKITSWLISVRIPVIHADGPADRGVPWLGALFQRHVVASLCAFILLTMGASWNHRQLLKAELMRVFSDRTWLLMLVVWAGLKVVHEAGHAIAAKRLGVRIGHAGVMFFLFAPIAYVDVTAAWSLPQRWFRVAIALAGIYVELIVASIAFWVWCFTEGFISHLAAQVFFVGGPATLLVNANPLLRLDGYYVVSDATEIPNLRGRGRAQLLGWWEKRSLGLPLEPSTLHSWRLPFATCHAAASVLFQVFWMGGLLFSVVWWAGPVGLIVASAALVLWCFLPLSRWLIRVWNDPRANGQPPIWLVRGRLLGSILSSVLLLSVILMAPSPFSMGVASVVRLSEDQVIRSPRDGFVRTVSARSGQRVYPGETLLEITDKELEVKQIEMLSEAESARLLAVGQEQRGELGLAVASRKRAARLEAQNEALVSQLADLQVHASTSGYVLTPRLQQMTGRFVKAGQELIHVGDATAKELLCVLDANQLPSLKSAMTRSQVLRATMSDGRLVNLVIERVRPRASLHLPEPALAATAGGTLPVRPVSDERRGEQLELLTPHVEFIAKPVDEQGFDLPVGQTGVLHLFDSTPLWQRLWTRLWMTDSTSR